MSNLSIHLEKIQKSFQPGEKIRGQVVWHQEQKPTSASLRLLWLAQGKETQEEEVVAEIFFKNLKISDSQPFELLAPSFPYSFQGNLFSIYWLLELGVGKDIIQEKIVISPFEQPICVTEEIQAEEKISEEI